MSLPVFSTQSYLFSTAAISGELFAPEDRYRLFGQIVYPELVGLRGKLATAYHATEGRPALEPVWLSGVTLLQYLDGVPDRLAVEMLKYHAGWNFGLNRQLGDPLFHPTTLVYFRRRIVNHQLEAVVFEGLLDRLVREGLLSRQRRQRLDSTQMLGAVSRMSRLDCVRESLRLALKELAEQRPENQRPAWWPQLWERYVDSQVDYRAGAEVLTSKLAEAGADAHQVLTWLAGQAELAQGEKAQLLQRVFGEQFTVATPPRSPDSKPPDEPTRIIVKAEVLPEEPPARPVESTPAVAPSPASSTGSNEPRNEAIIQPKGKGELASNRVQNPHDPEATYAVKGQGQKKKEHVGYKVQVAESVSEAELAPGEPTRNFITGIVTHPALESDEAGAEKMTAEQAAMGLPKPPVEYVDGAYVSAAKLAQAQAEGRELIGPAPDAGQKLDGRFTTEAFDITVEERRAICPGGHPNTQCSRLEEEKTGKVSFRFEWDSCCTACPLRSRCLGEGQKHRTITVGEHHTALQARRREQATEAFKARMKHRNGIEGTLSELVRAHGLRRARYRGLAKTQLQNYFMAAACNVKRWLRREAWKVQQAVSALAANATV